MFLAIIVGFSPAFAVLVRVARDKKPSYNLSGYKKQSNSRSGGGNPQAFAMNTISSKESRSKKKGLEINNSLWMDDSSSQEGLAPVAKQNSVVVMITPQPDQGV